MSREPEPLTLADAVHTASQVTDPAGVDEGVAQMLRWFEDRDEPITALPDVDAELAESTTALDPEGDDPAIAMTRAVVTYLAHRRDEIDEDREELLRLAARAEFAGEPPPSVADWLAAQGA